ncbi:hypothetical protein YTPLAS21_20470 [Candidatus Nitrosocosmicus sp.]|nr:hypothetical protein YTPLAS21_20470 [Candidatus Nitrosocosmicus sp.]
MGEIIINTENNKIKVLFPIFIARIIKYFYKYISWSKTINIYWNKGHIRISKDIGPL